MPPLQSARLMAFLPTTKTAEAKAFYAGKLGFPLIHDDGFAMVFNAAGTTLRVVNVQQAVIAPYTVLGWEVTDIASSAQQLTAVGITLERFPGMVQDQLGIWTARGGAAKVAWFKDPDGNVLSISQHA